jgi:hypothetical protein
MFKYDPKIAPKRGPKVSKISARGITKDTPRSYIEIAVDLPHSLVTKFLIECKRIVPETNLHESACAAIRWFVAQEQDWSFPFFEKRDCKFADLHTIQIPVVITEELQESQPGKSLEELAIKSVGWFVKQPLEQTFYHFKPIRLTIYSRNNVKDLLLKYTERVREYAKKNGLAVKITETAVVRMAMEQYLKWYVPERNN